MQRRHFLLGAPLALGACAGRWSTDFEEQLSPSVTRGWRVTGVDVTVPDELTVSEVNRVAPNADIVWHGELEGNRREQVAAILREGISRGAAELQGTRPVTFSVTLSHFHAVTPAAIAVAPSAVHNIGYVIQVFDSRTVEPLTDPIPIEADLPALTGAAAIVAAQEGQTQRVRIVHHLERVTKGWLGVGEDPRNDFTGLGR